MGFSFNADADISVPSIFSEHMVLQRSEQTPVWGVATPGETVKAILSGADGVVVEETAKADGEGRWVVGMDLSDEQNISPSERYELVLQASNRITISDVKVGEVWLASGQSNMELTMQQCRQWEEIKSSENDDIRFFTVENAWALSPADDVNGKWTVASAQNTSSFSAVAYYFAKEIEQTLGGAVGIIHATWGGTSIEVWMSLDALEGDASLSSRAKEQTKEFAEFPEIKRAWLGRLTTWLSEQQREDGGPSEAAIELFAILPAQAGEDGWATVTVPGSLPGDSIFWVRREITVSGAGAGKALTLLFDEIEGFDSVYFDGEFVGGRTPETFGGFGLMRFNSRLQYTVPASAVTPGEHTIAVRVWAPLGKSGMNGSYFTAGRQSLKGEWLIKTEKTFPSLTPEGRSSMPERLRAPLRPWNVAGTLYNGMITGLVPYGLRGVIWYQGESNTTDPIGYRTTFPLLIHDWREKWGDESLPFIWCQLPGFGSKSSDPNATSSWAGLRYAQTLALNLPHTGQAILIDTGEAGDIHPKDKCIVGERLSAVALANVYGAKGEYTGPTYRSMIVEGNRVRIRYDHIGGGLVAEPIPTEYLYTTTPKRVTKGLTRNSPNSQLEGFSILGENGKWVWAEAHIDGNCVLVSSPDIERPQAVRYAWAQNPTGNLYNVEGFPASPFSTNNE